MLKREPFQCRCCGHTGPHEIMLSLGELPLGNVLRGEEWISQPEATYPLDLAFCERCGLVQVPVTMSPEHILEQSVYFTSASTSVLEHGRELAEYLIESRRLGPQSLVVEVGCNDGALLEQFRQRGIPVLGIEPVAECAREAEEKRGVPTVVEFFTEDLAGRLKDSGKAADVVIVNSVLETVPSPGGFAQGLRRLLKEQGIAVLEVPYVKDMVDGLRFDCIGHLVCSWFSVTSLGYLFRDSGLALSSVDHLDSFRGGTLRVFASRPGGQRAKPDTDINACGGREHWRRHGGILPASGAQDRGRMRITS